MFLESTVSQHISESRRNKSRSIKKQPEDQNFRDAFRNPHYIAGNDGFLGGDYSEITGPRLLRHDGQQYRSQRHQIPSLQRLTGVVLPIRAR